MDNETSWTTNTTLTTVITSPAITVGTTLTSTQATTSTATPSSPSVTTVATTPAIDTTGDAINALNATISHLVEQINVTQAKNQDQASGLQRLMVYNSVLSSFVFLIIVVLLIVFAVDLVRMSKRLSNSILNSDLK